MRCTAVVSLTWLSFVHPSFTKEDGQFCVVGIVTRRRTGRPKNRSSISRVVGDLFSLMFPHLGPSHPLIQSVPKIAPAGVEITAYPDQVPRLRRAGGVPYLILNTMLK